MADDLTCAVCGESVSDPALLSDCRLCGTIFHLNPRADVAGIDCGDAWTGDAEAPALQFYCRPCIDRAQAASGGSAGATGLPSTPPGMPPLPPGAPPGLLEAMAGWAPPPDPTGATPQPASEPEATSLPPPPPRARRRRRFRRVDGD